jgi:hypothetical protein
MQAEDFIELREQIVGELNDPIVRMEAACVAPLLKLYLLGCCASKVGDCRRRAVWRRADLWRWRDYPGHLGSDL